jgi:hypothetical protein
LTDQLLRQGGELLDEVLLLGAVVVDVVEFPIAFELHHRLPRTAAHRTIAFMHPEQRTWWQGTGQVR